MLPETTLPSSPSPLGPATLLSPSSTPASLDPVNRPNDSPAPSSSSAIPPPPNPSPRLVSPPSRSTHLRPHFTLDGLEDSTDDLSSTAVAGASKRSLRERPSSTRSGAGGRSGTPAGSIRMSAADDVSHRPRHRSSRVSSRVGQNEPDSNGKGTDKTPADPPRSSWQKAAHAVEHNSVFPLGWVRPALTKRNLKTLFRCSLSAWIGMLFILLTDVQTVLGQASFFVLVIAFMQPPDKSFVQVAEIHFFTILFGAISWTWVCICAAICSVVRENEIPKADAVRTMIFNGDYLEPKVSIVCAVFLGVGSAFFCWIKIRTAPSPITLPCVLACVQMDVSLTLIPLFPYNYYTSGLVFFLPMTIQIGVSMLASIFIFPSSASVAYVDSVTALLNPLEDFVRSITDLFDSAGEGEASLNEWIALGKTVKDLRIKSSTVGLGAMKGLEGSLGMDISWGRLGAKDLQRLGEKAKNVNQRSAGVSFFFDILKSALLHDALDSTAFSVKRALNQSEQDLAGLNEALSTRPNSVYAQSEHETSRPSSPVHSDDDSAPPSPAGDLSKLPENPDDLLHGSHRDPLSSSHLDHHEHSLLHPHERSSRKKDRKLHFPILRSRSSHRSSAGHHHKSHGSHISLLEKLRRVQEPVGLYESQRYMNLEHSLSLSEVEQLHHQLQLLAHSSLPLLHALSDAMKHSSAWFVRFNGDRSFVTHKKATKRGPAFEEENRKVVEKLRFTLKEFKERERLEVIDPYKHVFDPNAPAPDDAELKKLPHRQLFWCFAFQFHILAFAGDVLRLVEEQEKVELKRPKQRLWMPLLAWSHLLPTRNQEESDGQHFGEEDPDRIPGLQAREDSMNGTQRRDPDSMEPSNAFLALLQRLHQWGGMLTSTQGLFAMKAGILTVLVATPSWTPQTANFFYENRGLWVIIMAQMSISLYSGETALAFVARLTATFWGCLVGLLVWSIGAPGTAVGSPYGIGAVTAVAFPCVLVFRLFAPSPPLTKILFSVSMGLVLGYGFQNGHSSLGQLTNASWGWDVAWRRFVNVIIGISAAWIFCFVPPTSSGKRSIRLSYAGLIGTLGDGICSIISVAGTVPTAASLKERERIEKNMMAIKQKLISLGARHESMSYEVSFRGMWPEERWGSIRDILIDLSSLLSQLHYILTTMDSLAWRKALLKRTQLNDSRFMGDVLAVLSLCSTCLRSATPLPQITPCPLVERYLERSVYGLRVLMGDTDHRDSIDGHGDGHGSENGSETDLHEKHHRTDGTIPAYLTASTLESEEYMRFAIACSTVFAIIGRLDRLMVACKTLLGETYHIDGVRAV